MTRALISRCAVAVAAILGVLVFAHEARADDPPSNEATQSTALDGPPPSESSPAPAEEDGTSDSAETEGTAATEQEGESSGTTSSVDSTTMPTGEDSATEGQGTAAAEQQAESSVATAPVESCTDQDIAAASEATATAESGPTPAGDDATSAGAGTAATEQEVEPSGGSESGTSCTGPSTETTSETTAETTASAEDGAEGAGAEGAAQPCPTGSLEAPTDTLAAGQTSDTPDPAGTEQTCAEAGAPVAADELAAAGQPKEAAPGTPAATAPEAVQAPAEIAASAPSSPAPGAAAPASEATTPPVPSESAAAVPAGQEEEPEPSDAADEFAFSSSSEDLDDASGPTRRPDGAAISLTIAATVLGGEPFQRGALHFGLASSTSATGVCEVRAAGSSVSRARERAARSARMTIAPRRLPDLPMPHAPTASAASGGSSTGSGSLVRDFAALAPGTTLGAPDLDRRLLGRAETQPRAAFGMLLARPD